jgi:hypothetical protein
MATSPLDCIDPCKIKGALRHVEFPERYFSKLGFGQKFRLAVLHERKQPIAATPSLFCSLIPELFVSAFHGLSPQFAANGYSMRYMRLKFVR